MTRLVLLTGVLLTGCVNLPGGLSAEAYVAHQSQPGKGYGPPPIGDHDSQKETTVDSIGTAVRRDNRAYFIETRMDYVLHSTELAGGPWIFNVRMGVRLPLEAK